MGDVTRNDILMVDSQLDTLAGQRMCLNDRLWRCHQSLTADDVKNIQQDILEVEALEDVLEAKLAVMLQSPAGVVLAAEWDAGWS